MAGSLADPTRAPVPFGRRAVPLLFAELQRPEAGRRLRALTSLCDLVHDPEQLHQTVTGGFLESLQVLFQDEDPSVRTQSCQLILLLTNHSIGRRALLSSSLLPPLAQLVADSQSSCRTRVHRVLNRLALLPAGAEALLPLLPLLMLKLRAEEEEEEEEEEEVLLLLSTLASCSRLDALPALASDAVSLLRHKLSHRRPDIRREAAAAMMALSVCEEGRQQVCEGAVLPVLVDLLRDRDVEVQTNAAGVLMYAVIITAGKRQCLDLNAVPVLLHLVAGNEEEVEEERRRRKTLVLYSLRALTALAEAPDGRRLLQEHLPLLARRSKAAEEDQDIWSAAQTAVSVITRTP